MKHISTIVFFLLYGCHFCYSQADSLSVQLFAESYASVIPNRPYTKTRPAFFVNDTRANNAGINLALAKLHYSTKRFRTNFGLMAGDYPTANLSNEAKWARNIYEANVGFKLSTEYNMWLDAGILPSHIGVETVIGKDNYTATRSIVADNTPYYETGVRLSSKPNNSWYLAMLALTGWQTISVPANQLGTHWGIQVTHTPTPKWTFNSSSYVGQVFYGRNLTRVYSNLYATYAINERTAVNLGWDIGFQENEADGSKTDTWNDITAIVSYKLKPGKWAMAVRYERFLDYKNLMLKLPVTTYYEFNVNHASFNLDWQPVKNLLFRAEANYMQSPFHLFFKGDELAAKQFSAFFIASYNFQFIRKTAELN